MATESTMTVQDMLEVLRRHFAYEAECDVEATLATMTDDCHYAFPFQGLELNGRAEIEPFYPDFFSIMPVKATETVKHWMAEDGSMFADVLCTADTADGEIKAPVHLHCRFRDGLLSQEHVYTGPVPFLLEWAERKQKLGAATP